jgi:hypothetical protein
MANGSAADPTAPALAELAESITAALLDPKNLEKLRKHAQEIDLETAKDGAELVSKAAPDLLQWLAAKIIDATSLPGPIGDALGRAAMDTLLKPGGARAQQGAEIGQRLINRLAGSGQALTPGYDGAAGLVGLVLSESIEAWLRGVLVELFSSLHLGPLSISEGIETFAQLQDVVEGLLGGGRLIRQVLGPIIHATAVTPATWRTNMVYRPELLGAGATVEAFLAGRYSSAQILEELRRQGLSDERIQVLIDNARKRLSFGDLIDLHERGAIADSDVIARAADLGYDAATAGQLLALATAKRRDRYRDDLAAAATAAYLDGDISEGELRQHITSAIPVQADQAILIDNARIRRQLRARSLSSAEERRLALKEIRAISDYRRALEREGYDLEARTALEIELRMELQARSDAEAAKAAAEAARAAEKAAAAAEKARRDAEAAARAALPGLADYTRAFVRGSIDRAALAAAIRREKIAITPADLELLLQDADQARAAALERERKAEEAKNKRPDPAIAIGTLEAAVLENVLTLEQYRSALEAAGYDPDERAILTELLAARVTDRRQAIAAREAAAELAARRSISLSDFERAVRLGVRTRADYAALLERLELPQINRALMIDLLDAEIAQDTAARATREAREAAAKIGGLSLGQRRRAVIAGVLTRAQYEAALVAAGWPAADQAAELALLDLELGAAGAAHARQAAIAAELATRALTLAQLRAAVLAGLRSLDDYAAALAIEGYGAEDTATLAALLARELAAAEAKRAAAEAPDPPADPPTLTLGQVQSAVRLSILPPEYLRAYLLDRGYSEEDAGTLLEITIATIPDVREAQGREEAIAGELAAKGISLADLKRAAVRGLIAPAAYAEELAARGYGEDDTALLVQLLEEEIRMGQARLRDSIGKVLGKAETAPDLGELEAGAGAGVLDAETIRAALVAAGVPDDTALVYARLLVTIGAGT